MQRIEVACVAASEPGYYIHVGEGALSQLNKIALDIGYSKVAVVLDDGVAPHWLSAIEVELTKLGNSFTQILTIKGGESSKSIEVLSNLWKRFHELGLDRRSLVLNIGGGALGDLGGLAASTYMRGMAFINIPTTLLSQVDASVGGKLAINFCEVKNLIGVFQQPRAVIADTAFLNTLPKRELRAGFAEVIKHGLIRDRDYFTAVNAGNSNNLDPAWLEEIVAGSCRIKASVVTADEKENGPRKILNFGHTLGHAIEALSHAASNPLLHGEAISLGMVGEAKISERMGMIKPADLKLIEETLNKFSLPVRLKGPISENDIIAKTRSDKKNIAGTTKWSLLKALGECTYDVEATENIVLDAVRYLKNG